MNHGKKKVAAKCNGKKPEPKVPAKVTIRKKQA